MESSRPLAAVALLMVLSEAAADCYSGCNRAFTRESADCSGPTATAFDGCWAGGVCCGDVTDCCEWTAGGIVLLVLLILVGLAGLLVSVWCCCVRAGGGCCCRRLDGGTV